MSLHYLLTALPDLPRKVSLDSQIDGSPEEILTFIMEQLNSTKPIKSINDIFLFEDLKNIIAKLVGQELVIGPFNQLNADVLDNELSTIMEMDSFPYKDFFTGVNFKQNIFNLEWELFNRFLDKLDSALLRNFYIFDTAVKYLFYTDDFDKKEYFTDLFNKNFDKIYILAKDFIDHLETMHPFDREVFLGDLKLSYIRRLERNIYFSLENLEAYVLKLLIHNRFMQLNDELAAKKMQTFTNFKLEF